MLIDDDGKWHGDFLFFNSYESLDCIDFENSETLDYSPDDNKHEVIKYKFKNEVLDTIPLEKRLIIRPEKVSGGGLLIHENVVSEIINYVNDEEFRFFKLSEYKLGDKYE